MVWHYFKKDFRLLWPMALALAAIQSLCAVRSLILGYFGEPRALFQLTSYMPVLVFLGIVVLTISAVHQDPLPGIRQDWLTRPVKRRDVWLSKLLFVLLLILLPIFVIDMLQQAALHLSLLTATIGAASRAAVLLCALGLPALVLGAITRTLAEAIIFGIVAAIAFSLLDILGLVALPPGTLSGASPATQWVQFTGALIVLAVAAVVILSFQYTRRRTALARAMALLGVSVAAAMLVALPSESAMAIQRWTWGRTPGGSAITLEFAPDRTTTTATGGETLALNDAPNARKSTARALREAFAKSQSSQYTRIRVPVFVKGMPSGNILWADQLTVRITAADGTAYFDGGGTCFRSGDAIGVSCGTNHLEIRSLDPRSQGVLGAADLIIPAAVYQRIKDQPVRLQMNLSLTTFQPTPTQWAATAGGVDKLAGLGSCATRIDADDDEVELRCLSSANMPSCIAALLMDSRTGKRNPELHGCGPNYAPFPLHLSLDVVSNQGISLPFRDPSGLAQYPVDGSAISESTVQVKTFMPADHFRRVLVIPRIRLAAWNES